MNVSETSRWTALVWLSVSLSMSFSLGVIAKDPDLDPGYRAVLRSGNASRLAGALNAGAAADARDALGNTPLMLAATYGDAACVETLLGRKASVNATNQAGATALMRAAHSESKVALLLKHGADPNARSALGVSALMVAARVPGNHRTVDLLLAAGADARAASAAGATALMSAAAAADPYSVRSLLRHRADVNANPAPGDFGFVFGGGRTALMWAAYRGNLEIVRLLLDAGADVNAEAVMGTALSQAAWGNQTPVAALLLENGANTHHKSRDDSYAALHWASSAEIPDPGLVNLLIAHGADVNAGGGDNIDAFMGTLQTPLMLARQRGDTPILRALIGAGATNESPISARSPEPPRRDLPAEPGVEVIRAAVAAAVAPLERSALESQANFREHSSKQDCTSCHQQYLPSIALGTSRTHRLTDQTRGEVQLIEMLQNGDRLPLEIALEPVFHPEPAHGYGYLLFAYAAEQLPPTDATDAWVHHLACIQAADGRWQNNIPRPPIQTSDVGATALAIRGLQAYPLPGRASEFKERIDRARRWLWTVRPENTEERVYQLLGLAWAGEAASRLQPLATALLGLQSPDGGWAQLPGLKPDAYATAQAVYALRIGAQTPRSEAALRKAVQYLLANQLADGTWHVRRRAFPFQPTMKSGFPHGRDSWISATASSWAVVALSSMTDIRVSSLKR